MHETFSLQGGDLRAALDGPQKAQYLWHNRGARLAADIACGLAYIHTTGVVHRCDPTYCREAACVVQICHS